LNRDEAWAVSAFEMVANEAAWDDTITWAMHSPSVNMSNRAHHRSVPNPIRVIRAVVMATPTRAMATRRRGPNRG